jgi:3',5'-cyclic AMP phosphodiesterase CpdA
MMEELKAPYYVVLGNHDISPVDTYESGRSPGVTRSNMIWTFQGHGYDGPGTHWSTDPLPGIHLIGLDSTRTGDWDGRMSREGVRFLERELAANPDKMTIVMLHHQPTHYCNSALVDENDFDKFVLRNAQDVLKILRKNPQVIMTVSGHRHISTRYKKDAHLAIFTSPSTMTWPMRYIVFEVDNQKISYNTYDIDCSPEVWSEAKKNIMDDKWWHPENEHPMTPPGNEKFVAFMLSEATKSDVIELNSDTKNVLAQK